MKTFVASLLVASAVVLRTTLASADDDNVFRTRFTVEQDSETIEAKACELEGSVSIGGRARPFDMRIDDRRCSSSEMQADAIALRVHVGERVDGRSDVVVQIAPIADGSIEESRTTVTNVGLELKSRITGEPRAQPTVRFPPQNVEAEAPQEPETQKKKYSPGLYAFGITGLAVGGAGIVGGAVVGIGTAFVAIGCGFSHLFTGGGSCNESGGWIAAASLLAGGGVFMIVGGVSMAVGGREVARVSAYATPNGGGLRVTF